VLLNDANIFPTYPLHLLDEIEKSALVLERIPSKGEKKDEKKYLIYILLLFAVKKKKKDRVFSVLLQLLLP
jgi:hypothetical protein